jgi:hypothetical protein
MTSEVTRARKIDAQKASSVADYLLKNITASRRLVRASHGPTMHCGWQAQAMRAKPSHARDIGGGSQRACFAKIG